MEGTRLGVLELSRELGAGGMGTVYLARAVESSALLTEGDRVAVKIVHPHLLSSPGFFKRFLREAEVGNRVRHENVVRTLDVDATTVDEATIHYLVMEYVDGRTLRDLLVELGFIPDMLLREIGRQVCAGLAAIHEVGAIHRDLKPENVLITDDDRIRIMDLGVARLVEESIALTKRDEFAGSLNYAAPEQFGQGELGPALDLYALGVLLYELGSGKNPFRRAEWAQVIAAHLHDVPPKLTERNPEISELLSELVARLIEKAPADRFESATQVRGILGEGEASAWWRGQEEDLRKIAAPRPKIPIRRETALYGRAEEIALLSRVWERARAGDGQAVLLDGEAGIGKTRFVDGFLAAIAEDDAQILYGAYLPAGGPGALSEAIVGHFGGANLEKTLRPLLPDTPTLVGAFVAKVIQQTPAGAGDDLTDESLHAMCCQLMRGLAARKPLVWVVDDVHFAGSESRRILLSMARACEGHPVLFVMASRPGGCPEELPHLNRLEHFRRIRLGRLSPREVVELLREEFASEELADRLGARIAFKTDGVPFFVFEIVRSLRDAGVLVETVDGSWATEGDLPEIDIPETVQDLIQARFVELEDEDRELLDLASCVGFEFDPDLVIETLGLKTVPALRRFAQLERKHGLIRSANDDFRFDHHQIRDHLYESVPPRLRREYHASLGDTLLSRMEGGECAGEDAVILVRHLLRGGNGERALGLHEEALSFLEGSYRNDEALELADALIDLGEQVDGAEKARLLLRKAGRLHILGRREEQRKVLEEATSIAHAVRDDELRVRARRHLGTCLLSQADYVGAESLLTESGRLASEIGATREEALAAVNLGVILIHRGRYPEARDRLKAALALTRRVGDPKLTGGVLRNLGTVVQAMGEQTEAEEYFREALGIGKTTGDIRLEAMAEGALAGLAYSRGHLEQAELLFKAQLEHALGVGDRNLEIDSLGGLGAVSHALGKLADAVRFGERSLALSRETGSRESEAASHLGLGATLLGLGAFPEVETHVEAALALARETGARWSEAYALHVKGLASDAVGTDSGVWFERAAEVYRELGNQEGLAEVLMAQGRSRCRRERWSDAMEFLDEALAMAREHEIPDVLALVPAYLSLHLPANAEAAREALHAYDSRLDALTRMEARFVLWEATRDEGDLREAARLLSEIREHAPESRRRELIANVPLHRRIVEATEVDGTAAG